MSVPSISELLDRTLVIAAHPDDECISAGALLQRMRHPLVVFCTDGAPRDQFFWRVYGSREQYAQTRKLEARAAATEIGVSEQRFLPIIDQDLHLNLRLAYDALEANLCDFHPRAILTLAYEGGHPDHDCCAFLSYILSANYGIPVWESPLYHRTSTGERQQCFLFPSEGTSRIRITSTELARKLDMALRYKSQCSVLRTFDLEVELFRPQFPYDFLKAPATDLINYEAWKWPVSSRQLCDAFRSFMDHSTVPLEDCAYPQHSQAADNYRR